MSIGYETSIRVIKYIATIPFRTISALALVFIRSVSIFKFKFKYEVLIMFSYTNFSCGKYEASNRTLIQESKAKVEELRFSIKELYQSNFLSLKNFINLIKQPYFINRITEGLVELKKAGILTKKNVDDLLENAHFFHGVVGDNLEGCFERARKFNITAQEMFTMLVKNAPNAAAIDCLYGRLDYSISSRENFMTVFRYAQFINGLEQQIRTIDPLMRIPTQNMFNAIMKDQRQLMKNALIIGTLPKLKDASTIIFFGNREQPVARLHPLENRDILKKVFSFI